jgi:hypothetical protein
MMILMSRAVSPLTPCCMLVFVPSQHDYGESCLERRQRRWRARSAGAILISRLGLPIFWSQGHFGRDGVFLMAMGRIVADWDEGGGSLVREQSNKREKLTLGAGARDSIMGSDKRMGQDFCHSS